MFHQTCSFLKVWLLPVLPVMWLCGCKPAPPTVKPPEPLGVQVMQVQQALPEHTSFVGTYGTRRSIPLAPTQAGRIASIQVQNGQYVHQGDVLVAFQDTFLLETVAQAQAEADAARLDAAQAGATARRSRGLDVTGSLSTGAIEERFSAAKAAQAKYQAARAGLHQAQIQLAEAAVRAPENGWVVSVTGVAGSLVEAGHEVVRLAAGEAEAHIKVPANFAVQEGEAATVLLQIRPEGGAVRGVVREIGTVDPATQMRDVFLAVGHVVPTALNGLVTVGFTAPALPCLVRVPLTALVAEGAGHVHLWGVTQEAQPHIVVRPVTVAGLRGADALIEGLQVGESIVTSGVDALQAGQSVRVVSLMGEP